MLLKRILSEVPEIVILTVFYVGTYLVLDRKLSKDRKEELHEYRREAWGLTLAWLFVSGGLLFLLSSPVVRYLILAISAMLTALSVLCD